MTDLQALAELIKPSILQVWDAIGSDVLALVTDPGELENAGAIEMCVDADRLRTMGGKDGEVADMLLEDAHSKHGWDDVIEALSNSIDLI